MQAFFDAWDVYLYGANGLRPDGTRAPGTLPDGTIPEYSTAPEGIHGDPSTGLAQERAFPTGDLGYGADLYCVDDFRPDFPEIDPNSPLAVAQDAYHRLNTQRGLIIDDPTYGTDVKGLLQKAFDTTKTRQFRGQLRNELLKDDRIDPSTLQVDFTVDLPTSTITLNVAGRTKDGPFSLVMTASDSEVLLKAITGSA